MCFEVGPVLRDVVGLLVVLGEHCWSGPKVENGGNFGGVFRRTPVAVVIFIIVG